MSTDAGEAAEAPADPGLPVVAVDTGGTFTDVLLLRKGALRALKVPSTPDDPARAVVEGIRRVLGDPPPPFLLLHGSTVATNTLLEGDGARVVLVTNEGFEDVIEIGRQDRPELYALVGSRPPPLVAREDRLGIAGRLGPDGGEVEPLSPEELDDLPGRVEGAGAVAVSLLHAYADPEHEARVAGRLRELDVPVSVSSELLPEYREYERTSTTVVNAYVAPRMGRYLSRIGEASGARRVRIMGSNGGALSLGRAAREPVHTILSGPAGGVVGALAGGRDAGFDDLISFDMGGTSTDVSLVPGELLHTRELVIAGRPVAIPVLDIHTVGAGGGSIARIDPGGALRVGPRSAGANPGPVAYGLGGEAPTVTDAHVWLGRLPADAFLGGEATLDRDAVEAPLRELADALGGSPWDAAEGIIDVANAAMERALRVISVERGRDPARFTVVAFGGAGGLHVAELAGRLGAARAMVPPDPGVLSAYGMLAADVVREASRTVLAGEDAPERVEKAFSELEREAEGPLLEEGVDPAAVDVVRHVDARYRGQSFELRVPAAGWPEAFHRAHEERYGFARRERPVVAVTLRAVARAPGPRLPPREPGPGASGEEASAAVRHRGEEIEARRVPRGSLAPGDERRGPAVVTEYSSTTWVPPGWTVRVDERGNLVLEEG